MSKQTLYFSNPAYLSTKLDQLVIDLGADKTLRNTDEIITKSIEDIGLIIIDNQQITLTSTLITKLLENNVALITCNAQHMPTGLMLNLDGHTLQSDRFKAQVDASAPLKKQLWQQVVSAKIINQGNVLKKYGKDYMYLLKMGGQVKSGDSDNMEAQAAAFYWKKLFDIEGFRRDREGVCPNNYLNYGYAILRAIVARALVGSGLLPTLGIFHRNQYNAYCLADDIMEAYRPVVDVLVFETFRKHGAQENLPHHIKADLLTIPTMDVMLDGQKSPLQNAVAKTTASLAKCYENKIRKISCPEIIS
jgi:CRISPR-associated protein Cas1